MKFKSLKILLVVLIVLVAIAFIYTGIQKRPKVVKPFTNKEIKYIEIKAQDTLCVFEKTGREWQLKLPVEYAVDTAAFNRLIKGLKDLEIGEVISKRTEKYADFGVDESGTEVKVCYGKDTAVIILGKMASDFEHWWIRLPPKSEVYLSKGLSKYIVNKRPDDWRDHTILSFNKNELREIDLDGQKIESLDTLWIKDGKPIETAKIDQILALLSNLRADGFSKEEGFEPEFTVKLTFEVGSEEVLHIGKKVNAQHTAKLEKSPVIFLLNSWKIDRLKEAM
ncbi:MAG: DUF4340 domain-containing protein [bacterium]|nr:DUF4340 domain-containing protein [bacterium]